MRLLDRRGCREGKMGDVEGGHAVETDEQLFFFDDGLEPASDRQKQSIAEGDSFVCVAGRKARRADGCSVQEVADDCR